MLPYGGKRCKIGTTGKHPGKMCGCCCCRSERRTAMIGRKKRARAAAKKEIQRDRQSD